MQGQSDVAAESTSESPAGAAPGPDASDADADPASASPTASQAVRVPLSTYSWDELKSIADQIAAAPSDDAGLSIAGDYGLTTATGQLGGDTKDIEVAGYGTASVRIAGFRHDQKADGSGPAGITFEVTNSLLMRVMNTMPETNIFGYNTGGWEASEMRAWLNTDFLSAFPVEVQANVVEV